MARAITEEAVMALAVEQNQNAERAQNIRSCTLGFAFVGGLGAATLFNMLGYTGWAMGLGMIGLCCMAMFIINLKAPR
jgi:hypothetical protein